MMGRTLYVSEPGTVEVRDRSVPGPAPGEVRVRTALLAVSPGTELLVYRGEVPESIDADETIDAPDGLLLPDAVRLRRRRPGDGNRRRRRRGVARPAGLCLPPSRELLPGRPRGADRDDAARRAGAARLERRGGGQLRNGRPPAARRASVVFDQGSVGLLTTAVLSEFPLAELVAVDRYGLRRELARSFGADRAVGPGEVGEVVDGDGADVSIELSGAPAASTRPSRRRGTPGRCSSARGTARRMSSWARGRPTTEATSGCARVR